MKILPKKTPKHLKPSAQSADFILKMCNTRNTRSITIKIKIKVRTLFASIASEIDLLLMCTYTWKQEELKQDQKIKLEIKKNF